VGIGKGVPGCKCGRTRATVHTGGSRALRDPVASSVTAQAIRTLAAVPALRLKVPFARVEKRPTRDKHRGANSHENSGEQLDFFGRS